MITYRALAHVFAVNCDHDGLSRYIAEVFSPLRAPAKAGDRVTTYDVRVNATNGHVHRLLMDGSPIVASHRPDRPYAHLLHQINARAITDSAVEATLLHASAALSPLGALLFTAPMESGKSTLVTGLTRRGWGYITDEIVAIDADLDLRPFRRSVSLDPGSWPLFPDLRPAIDPSITPYLPPQWQVHPEHIGDIATGRLPVAGVVLPRYVPRSRTRLHRMDPVEALRDVLACCFTFPEHTERDLDVLAGLVDRVPCFSLTTGDLASACTAVMGTFSPSTAHTSTAP